MRIFSLTLICLLLGLFTIQTASAQENSAKPVKEGDLNIEAKKSTIQDFAGMGMLTTIWLRWTPYEAEGFSLAGYKIYRRDKSDEYGKAIAMPGPVANWTDFNLEKGKKYFYRISAYSPDGKETELTNELTVETGIKAPFQPFTGEVNILRVPTLDILCAIYGEMPKEETERIKKGIEEARLFIWRNSRCRVNLNLAYLHVEQNIPALNSEKINTVEEDLRKRGYVDGQFTFVFIAAPDIKEIKAGFNIFGNTAAGAGGKVAIPYPGADSSVEYEITWPFTKSFCESLDVILNKNGSSPIFKDGFSDGFRSAAKGLASIQDLEKLKAPCNGYIETFDADDDRIPDADDRVPLDEARFPSDARYKDTDNDYLDDMDELTASIWRSASNMERDTDKDKLVDGKDPLPLVDFQSVINSVKFIPSIDGKIEDTWKVLSKGCFWSTKENPNVTIYAGWDDSNLYLAAKSDKKRNITLQIKDDPKTDKTRDYLLLWEGKEVLLDKTIDYKKVPPVKTGVLAHWIGDDGTFQTEASIPIGKEGLKPEKGRKVLLQLSLTNPEDKDDSIWVTEFDGYYEVTLEK